VSAPPLLPPNVLSLAIIRAHGRLHFSVVSRSLTSCLSRYPVREHASETILAVQAPSDVLSRSILPHGDA